MQDSERLIQLLQAQSMHLEEVHSNIDQERINRLSKDKSKLEEYIKRTKENAIKIVEATKIYLAEYPFVYSSTIRQAIIGLDRIMGKDRVTGTEISADQGGKQILFYQRRHHDNISYFSSPLVVDHNGRWICNEIFTEDPDIGYLLFSKGLSEILKRRRETLPYRLDVKNHPFTSGRTINIDRDGNAAKNSYLSRLFIIYKDSYSKMLEELSKEMDRWISGSESGKKEEEILFKKVEKTENGK